MKKWQPPIPSGALCSPDAIAINIALPLLGWCYDQVDRDGWLSINLHEVAGDISVPYHTVKKWWALIEGSSFIGETIQHGRNGMRVRIADAWLDWRSRDAQYSVPNPVPKSPDGDETGPEMVPINEQSGHNRDLFGTETGPNMVPNDHSNKVLNNDQESGVGARAKKRAQPPPKKAQAKERDATLDHPAVVIYRDTFKSTPNAEYRRAIAMAVTHIELWSDVCKLWKTNRWDYLKVENLISRYQKNGKGTTNGTRSVRSNARQDPEWAEWDTSGSEQPF